MGLIAKQTQRSMLIIPPTLCISKQPKSEAQCNGPAPCHHSKLSKPPIQSNNTSKESQRGSVTSVRRRTRLTTGRGKGLKPPVGTVVKSLAVRRPEEMAKVVGVLAPIYQSYRLHRAKAEIATAGGDLRVRLGFHRSCVGNAPRGR
jgi:hypothetical protein